MNLSAVPKQVYSDLRTQLPARLPEFLAKQRWFGGKARHIVSTEVIDIVPMQREGVEALLLVVAVRYAAGRDETYAVPVVSLEDVSSTKRDCVLLQLQNASDRGVVLVDASSNADLLALLLFSIDHEMAFRGEQGQLRGFRSKGLPRFSADSRVAANPTLLRGEQSNTSVIYDQLFILKLFRQLEAGVNPELELGTFLTEKAHFPQVPQLLGYLEYRDPTGQPITQAILQSFVPNQGDAWRHMTKSVAAFYELTRQHSHEYRDPVTFRRGAAADQQLPRFARAPLQPDSAAAALLGKRTAELHLALASDRTDPAFAPEPFTVEFQQQFRESLLQRVSATLRLLSARRSQLSREVWSTADNIQHQESEIKDVFGRILNRPIHAARTRIHGDYHLGQVLYTGSDFVIIDFEGEPARPLAERRTKRSPLQDVAGMMRSFHYAAFAPLLGASGPAATGEQFQRLRLWAEAWSAWLASRFLAEYLKRSGGAPYLPANPDELHDLLKLHLLEKAIYELNYELNNRPTWVGIPVEGIAGLLAG
jgi:trehalose synthase-fused probable maltokinase